MSERDDGGQSVSGLAGWNRVLTLAEIKRVMRDGPRAVPDGLIVCEDDQSRRSPVPEGP